MKLIKIRANMNELQTQILILIKNNAPLSDFPLMDYSTEDICDSLQSLRSKGLIKIEFNMNNILSEYSMDFNITEKGRKALID
jgi:hypothetical protein